MSYGLRKTLIGGRASFLVGELRCRVCDEVVEKRVGGVGSGEVSLKSCSVCGGIGRWWMNKSVMWENCGCVFIFSEVEV